MLLARDSSSDRSWALARSIRAKPHHLSAPGDSDRQSRFSASFLHSGDVLRVVVLAMTVLGRPDAQEKLEGVAEIVAIIASERVGAVVDGELGAETNVDTIAVRQVADVTERVPAHWKNFGFIERLEDKFVSGFLDAFPAKVNCVSATLVI